MRLQKRKAQGLYFKTSIDYIPNVNGTNCFSYFSSIYKANGFSSSLIGGLEAKNKLDYIKRITHPNIVLLNGKSMMTGHDGDYEYHKKILIRRSHE